MRGSAASQWGADFHSWWHRCAYQHRDPAASRRGTAGAKAARSRRCGSAVDGRRGAAAGTQPAAAQGDGSAWLVAENGTLIRRAANIDEVLDEQIALGARLPYETEVLAAVQDEDDRHHALFDFAPALAGRLTPIGAIHGAPPGALKF